MKVKPSEPMTTKIEQCQKWIETHRDILFDCLRIYLGVGLFVKGIYFFSHPELLAQFTNTASGGGMASLAAAVPYVHVIGGLLVALGIFVRWAALAQLPVLFGAVFYVNLPRVIDTVSREAVEFSVLVAFLMLLVCLRGTGPLSILRLRKGDAKDRAVRSHSSHDTFDDIYIDVIRMFLGAALLFKGIYFMEHREQLVKLLEESGTWVIVPVTMMHYMIPAHFAGGLLLAVGLVTRWAALAQVPVLLGAVFYIYLPRLVSIEGRQNFEFTALVLFLTILLSLHGGGRWSIDHLLSSEESHDFEAKPAT